jgi:hypothetical protein
VHLRIDLQLFCLSLSDFTCYFGLQLKKDAYSAFITTFPLKGRQEAV